MNYLIDPVRAVHQVHWQELLATAERSRRGRSSRAARRQPAALRENLRRQLHNSTHAAGPR